MEEELTISAEYKKAFNEGYLLAKQLGLKVNDIKFSDSDSVRFQAMAQGIKEFDKEHSLSRIRDRKRNASRNRPQDQQQPKTSKNKSRGRGFNM